MINDKIKSQVSEKRWNHIEGVTREAVKLAKNYGVSEEKAETAALFHDLCRSFSVKELNGIVKQIGLDDTYLDNIALSHSKAAALLMSLDYGITDTDTINAVCYHTTGRHGMSTLEKIIYVADAIEPGRQYEGIEEIREMAYADLDEACRLILEKTMKYIKNKGELIHPDSESALRFLKL